MTRSPTLCGGISVQVQFSTIRLFWKMTVLWSTRAEDPRDWCPPLPSQSLHCSLQGWVDTFGSGQFLTPSLCLERVIPGPGATDSVPGEAWSGCCLLFLPKSAFAVSVSSIHLPTASSRSSDTAQCLREGDVNH